MYTGKLVFAQVMDNLPWHRFHRAVDRYDGNRKVKSFPCSDRYRCMAFARLTCRPGLRDIDACLRAQAGKPCHMGIRGGVAGNTLANANSVRDRRRCAAFTQHLTGAARKLYSGESHGLDPGGTACALDSSTIDLCLSLFPWARFRRTRSAPAGCTRSPAFGETYPRSSTSPKENSTMPASWTSWPRSREPPPASWTAPVPTSPACTRCISVRRASCCGRRGTRS